VFSTRSVRRCYKHVLLYSEANPDRNYMRLKLGGGQAYDRSAGAVAAGATNNRA
jgi:hypothetical protein